MWFHIETTPRLPFWFQYATDFSRKRDFSQERVWTVLKRKSFSENHCPIARALDTIGDWWSMLIVREAFFGRRRFGEFQKNLGLAKNILTVRLRKLVSEGILKIGPASDGSAYQEYVLTEKGRGLFVVMVALRQWGEHFLFEPGELGNRLVDNELGEEIAPLEIRAKDGRVLNPGDLHVNITKPADPSLCGVNYLAITEGDEPH
jgi:DNA-binding HxlR family transcriptional regulator